MATPMRTTAHVEFRHFLVNHNSSIFDYGILGPNAQYYPVKAGTSAIIKWSVYGIAMIVV